MRVPRPSPALVVAFLALLLALGGVAFAATGSAVNIVDPSDPSLAAKVDKTGKLEVGDGGVPLTVDGTITTKATTPPGAWSASAFVGVGLEEKLLAQPTPGAIDITAIHVSAPYNISSSSSYTRVHIRGWSVPGSDCDVDRQSFQTVYVAYIFPSQPHQDATFTSPIALRPPPGRMECVGALVPLGPPYGVVVNISGFRPSMP